MIQRYQDKVEAERLAELKKLEEEAAKKRAEEDAKRKAEEDKRKAEDDAKKAQEPQVREEEMKNAPASGTDTPEIEEA